MFTPLLLLIYKKCSNQVSTAIFIVLGWYIFCMNFLIVAIKDIGAMPVMNEEFLAKIYMRPWFHFNSFLLGMVICIAYKKYLTERNE